MLQGAMLVVSATAVNTVIRGATRKASIKYRILMTRAKMIINKLDKSIETTNESFGVDCFTAKERADEVTEEREKTAEAT